MNKRYQVFISSTFEDLEKERKLLTQILLRKDCFPAGMEWFPAVDEEQFEYIKQVIDDSDYYVIVLGGVYGSIAPDGISYTEKEYDYAVSKGKKVIALVQENPENKESNEERLSKLLNFRKKIRQERLINFWNSLDDLISKFATSLDYTMSHYPEQGWIRCDNDTCDVRLGFIDITSGLSSMNFTSINTIHIMASGTSSYIPFVKNLLKKNATNNNIVDLYVFFRLGNDANRLEDLTKQYNTWWNNLKNSYPKLQFHFCCIKDFKSSFRGVIINQEIGFVGFYVRENNKTFGTLDDSMFVDKNTNVGRYILDCFLKCFKEQPEYPTLKSCVENSL